MTPSGGARNPYEAYVYVRRVTDIKPGIYHYSGLTNSLGFITDSALPEPGDILGEQSWFDDAAAVILLVANFERTWWKYPHPTGFRVVRHTQRSIRHLPLTIRPTRQNTRPFRITRWIPTC